MRFLVTVILSTILFSCSSTTDKEFIIKKELEMLDTLEQRLAVAEQKLDIDYPEIKERIEEMSIDIMKMRTTEKTFPLDLSSKMVVYSKIKKEYENFYEPFKYATKEMAELKVQIITLKESVLKQEFGKEKFKEYYNNEKMALSKLEIYIGKYIQPVLDMEMEYRRIQKRIDDFLYGDEIEAMKQDQK